MQPTPATSIPRWQDIRETCGGLQQAMDAMIEQVDFASFRPSVARAIAQARDERQRADHPIPIPPRMVVEGAADRLEAIAVDLAPSDLARAIVQARA